MSKDDLEQINKVLRKGEIEKRFWCITDKIMALHDRHSNLEVDNKLNKKQVVVVDMLLCNIQTLIAESEKVIETLKED